ncbi:ATP-binding protein [Pseudorhodoplanes sp.]|uniref:ATP-binding protein n=1 Tax=Pseudorhodoplanes sp. TaxID=1934341 RepID=UPI00391C5E5A
MGRIGPKRKAAKRARKAAPAHKRLASTRRAVEAALAALAHDIRTPLTGILALADLLAASEIPEPERAWARSIRSAADHLAQQTSLVLDAVKADRAGLALRQDAFSPRMLAQAIATSLTARAGAGGLAANIAIADDVPAQAIGDPVRLRAALENLIDNAVKFTARGQVRFAVSASEQPRGRIGLTFTIADTGIGLTRTEIAKLFRPFAQANKNVSSRFGGTGLGLVLVRRLAKAMGGDLAVASKKGEGSIFTLAVTVKAAAKQADRSASEVGGTATGPPLRILCAEDNPFARVVLNTMLTALGHSVDFAGTGERAVNAASRGGYDLVLMDVTLPDIDGLEATRRIRALPGEAGRVPVIGMSGRSTERDRQSACEAGMTDYLEKPVGPALLVAALGRLH